MAAAQSGVTSIFHGNGLSVSADLISVLVATCSFANAEHIHVLNRRNYFKIPEIESPSCSVVIIIREQGEHGCPWGEQGGDGEMTECKEVRVNDGGQKTILGG